MTTQLTRYQESGEELGTMQLGQVLAQSGYFQDARDAAQAIVKVLAGREMGIGPVASMTGIYIVKGRVTLSANLMAAQIKRSGKYNYLIRRMDDTGCEIEFFEGATSIGKSAFTEADAKSAGLLGGDNWRKFPRNMYFARAMSNGAKWFTPDVFSGPIYTPDELSASAASYDPTEAPATLPPAPRADTVTGEVIDDAPAQLADDCEGERTLLKQLRDEIKSLGGTNKPLTTKQVAAMSCQHLRAEIEAAGAALDMLKKQTSNEWDEIDNAA